MATVAAKLQEIKQSDAGDQLIAKTAYSGLSDEDKAFYQARNFIIYQGKVRELLRRGQQLFIFHTDRLTAFDKYIGMVPFKGLILSEMSRFWLKHANSIVPTHLIRSINERVLEVQTCEPIKAEVVVRGYMAGSMGRSYARGIRQFCGQSLPEGLAQYRPLPTPLITPTTKAAAFEHDEEVSPEGLIQQGVCTPKEWARIEEMAFQLFAEGQKVYADKGWILVDTKYEFGRRPDGELVVIDEIHTPDSSRLWLKGSYEQRLAQGEAPEMLDKEIVRRYLLDQGFSGEGHVPHVPADILVSLAEVYLQVAETLLGEPLTIRSETIRPNL